MIDMTIMITFAFTGDSFSRTALLRILLQEHMEHMNLWCAFMVFIIIWLLVPNLIQLYHIINSSVMYVKELRPQEAK